MMVVEEKKERVCTTQKTELWEPLKNSAQTKSWAKCWQEVV